MSKYVKEILSLLKISITIILQHPDCAFWHNSEWRTLQINCMTLILEGLCSERKGYSVFMDKYLYQKSYFAKISVVVASTLDKGWLHSAFPTQLVILPIFSLFSACFPGLFAVFTIINVTLCLEDSSRGASYIFACLFPWHIFLICWNVGQGLLSKCIVLWSNKSIVWVPLLPSNKWHFCLSTFMNSFDKYPPEIATLLRQKTVVFLTGKPIHMHFSFWLLKKKRFFYFLQWCAPLHVFLFPSSCVWLFCISDCSFRAFFAVLLAIWRPFLRTRLLFPCQQFLMYGANLTKMPSFNCEMFDISVLSCWCFLPCNVTVCSCSAS